MRGISNDTKQTIGEILRHLRRERLWSQAELASRIGTTSVSIGRWENNITRPNLHFQQQLCEIFAKSPEDLGFLPQSEPEHEELSQAPVPSTPLQRVPERRNAVPWQGRNILLVVMACLSLLLLLSGFFFYKEHVPSSISHLPSCQTPSSHESATAIYTQVMCSQSLFTLALDQQDTLQWDENNECRFQQGAYHVLLPASEYVAECFAHKTSLGPNFAVQVDMTVLKGSSGGLAFRAQGPSSNWDVIVSRVPINIWGQYNFDLASSNELCHLSKDPYAPTYCDSPHGTITYGTGVTNTMTVVALGSQVYLYVNGFFIDQARAPASSPLTGFLGVFANGSLNTGDVAFRHLQIWNI